LELQIESIEKMKNALPNQTAVLEVKRVGKLIDAQLDPSQKDKIISNDAIEEINSIFNRYWSESSTHILF
jgi:hypothetical protein